MFSDQHHIEKIRERLHKGNAAVMVGAGFSLNATQLSKSKGSFLTWPQLVDGLKNKLYLEEEAKKYAPTDPLKLAAEFEFEFGREALEQFLKDSLPDNNYVPAQLHKMLLSLPWADIFTTNYDTLIERTREFVYDRKYSLVQTVNDIPNSVRPRIVKLHGSFPSHRPFIFTEEDYRTYPNKFAPFVNLVQQSIMENTLCLIGFSGDDPNFKNWIGWVRDNLGDYASSIYFCGFLTESQKRQLESLKIKVIDFSKLFTDEKKTNNHGDALQWFFLELMKPESRIPYYWPELNKNNPFAYWSIPQNVKEKLSYSEEDLTKEYNVFDYYDFEKGIYTAENIIKLSKKWEEDRKHYPQWVVAPRRAINYIWNNTDYELVRSIVNAKKSLQFKQYLSVLYEFIWRLETGLLSLSISRFSLLIPVIEEIIFDFAEYIGNYEGIKARYQVQNKDISEIEQQCVKLCFSLVNYYREQYNKEKVYELLKLYEELITRDEELLAEYYYQQCLLELNHLNYSKVIELLNSWPINYNLPYWQVRRASILIELRELKEAEEILLNSLNEIRKRNVEGNDIELLSQESWLLRILNAVKNRRTYNNLYNNIEKEEFVKKINCDANQIYEDIVTAVDGSLIKRQKRPKSSFDPGTKTHTISFNNQFEVDNKNALQLIKMVEKTGHRFKINNTVFDKERIITACEFLAPTNFMLALVTAIQLGNKDYIKAFLSREVIATIDKKILDTLFENIFESLVFLNSQRNAQRLDLFSDTRFPILLEILSRLTIKLNKEQLDKCLKLAIEIYLSIWNQNNIHIFSIELNNLFKRIFYALDAEDIVIKLNDLLKLPVAFEQEYIVDPFYYIGEVEFINKDNLDIGSSVDQSLVKNLIEELKRNTKTVNSDAIMRLMVLSNLGILDDTQKKEIGEFLLDKNIYNTNFYFKSLITYFFNSEELFKDTIKSGIEGFFERKFVDVFGEENGQKFSYSSGRAGQLQRHFEEISQLLLDNSQCINFSYFRKSILTLIENLETWWHRNKNNLRRDSDLGEFPWVLYKRFLFKLLYTVPSDKLLFERLHAIVTDLETLNIHTVSFLPIFVLKGLENQSLAEKKLIKYLHANDDSKVFDALEGLNNWVILNRQGLVDTIPQGAVDELIQKVFLRRFPYLDQSIWVLVEIINLETYPLSQTQMEKILEALKNLYDETELKSFSDNYFGTVKTNENLSIQSVSTKLAHDIYLKFEKDNLAVPNILRLWKARSQGDTIPEIRKNWR
jgi:hypothetical protein